MSHSNHSSDFPPEFLSRMAKEKSVSAGELKALEIALKKNSAQAVSSDLGITKAAARKRLGEVYKKFEISGKGPGKLASLRSLLQTEAQSKTQVKVQTEAQSQESQPQNAQAQNQHQNATTAQAQPSFSGLASKPAHEPASSQLVLRAIDVLKSSDEQPNEPIAPHLHDASGLASCYGRSDDLDKLERWIGEGSGKKLLAICGIGGIGKTTLAALLSRRVMDDFEKCIWLPVEEKPPTILLTEAIALLRSEPVEGEHHPSAQDTSKDSTKKKESRTSHNRSVEHLIQTFITYLERTRCLVILDGFESVFNSYSGQSHKSSEQSSESSKTSTLSTFNVRRDQQASAYKPGFGAYTELLRAIQTQSYQREVMGADKTIDSEKDINSCVIITSREKPRELLAIAQSSTHNAHLHTLDGLRDEEALLLLRSFHLTGSEEDYQRLITRYYGHPMALRLASSTIKDAFFGRIRDFLDQEISVFDDLRSVIKPQFKRLSLSEKEVMYWLAINRDRCTIEGLQEDIVSEDHKRNVIYTLRSLQRRFLIEVQQEGGVNSYRMHPIVADYVLNKFIRDIFTDLLKGNLSLFNSHALMKANADDELREFQRQHIIQPILERLNNYCKSLYQVDKLLSDRLNTFRDNNPRRLGYAGGNFVNLLVQLSEGRGLREKNFSQLTIWQAYLQGVQLREVNFTSCKLDRTVFTETLSDVMSVAFSDAKNAPQSQVSSRSLADNNLATSPLMAAGDANGKVHLWSTRSPAEKCAEWVAHSSWVRAIAFVPNQHLLVTGGDDNRVRLWQIPDATLQGRPEALNYPTQVWQKEAWNWVHTVAVSPDGKIIASGGHEKITLYRVSDGKEINSFADEESDARIHPIQKNRIRDLAFSPDGCWLASCGDDYIVRVWSVAAAQEPGGEAEGIIRFKGHSALIQTVRFSEDSKLLVSAGEDNVLRVWNIEQKTLQAKFDQPSDCVRSVAITRSGLLASGGDDCVVRLWDINSQTHIKDIPTGKSRIWSVAFQQQDNKLLLLAGGDKQSLMLWDVTSEQSGHSTTQQNANQQNANQSIKTKASVRPIRTYRGYTNGIRSVAFLSDQRIIGGGDSGELLVWDKDKGDRKATLPFHHGRIWSIAVDAEHARIASASDDHTIRLWNAETGQCLTTLSGHNNWVRSVAFSRHGRFLVSASDDCSVRIWNTASGFCRRNIERFDAWVRSVAFDPNNSRYVITGGDEEVVQRWDIKDEHAMRLTKHKHRISAVACSTDGRFIASGSDDTTVAIWDMEVGKEIYRFENADLGIKSVAFSPNGRYLAGGGEDQLVYIWDLTSTDPEESCLELRPRDYQGLSGGIRSVAFSADGQSIISGGLDEMVRIGDLGNMEDGAAQVMKPLIERDRPYENIEIEDIQGLSGLQVANLVTLGAVSRTRSLLH